MPDSPLSLLPSLAAIVPADLLLYAVDLAEPVLADQNKKLEFTLLKAYNDALYQAAGSYQPLDADLTTIAGLAHADGNLIVSDGAAWTVESGATARASLGLAAVAATGAYADLSGLPVLAAVALSGDYGDLINLPTLGTLAALNDAPSDGSTYGRNNGAWVVAGGGGSSLPVADTQTIVMGSADNTKLLRFEIDGFTAGATRAMTPPNADATLAGLEVTQNFTANQGFGITPTAQMEIQSTDASKQALIVRAPAGALTDIFQVYDKDGNVGFVFDRFAKFKVNFGLEILVAGSGNTVFNTNSSSSGNVTIQSRSNGDVPMRVKHIDASSTVKAALKIGHNRASGTPGNGLGTSLEFEGETTTTEDTAMGRVYTTWNDASHNSAVADIVANAYYNAAGTFTASEIWRGRAGASPLFAVLGATPVARQAHIADPSGGGTQDAEARTAIDSILAALRNFGFLATS